MKLKTEHEAPSHIVVRAGGRRFHCDLIGPTDPSGFAKGWRVREITGTDRETDAPLLSDVGDGFKSIKQAKAAIAAEIR